MQKGAKLKYFILLKGCFAQLPTQCMILPHCQLIYIHSYTNCMVSPQDCKMLKEKHNRLASCWPRKLSRCMLISMSLNKRDLISNLLFYGEHLKNEALKEEHIKILTQHQQYKFKTEYLLITCSCLCPSITKDVVGSVSISSSQV